MCCADAAIVFVAIAVAVAVGRVCECRTRPNAQELEMLEQAGSMLKKLGVKQSIMDRAQLEAAKDDDSEEEKSSS